jgi:phosphatidylglycerophosphatase A
MKFLAKTIATFFGTGYFPLAPGTFASLVIVLLYKYFLADISVLIYLGLAIIIYIVGIWSSSRVAQEMQTEDPRKIVIDEVLGQWLALFALEPTWRLVLVSFFLFRFFDIVKPLFIKKAETFRSGWGIMLDDIMAGMYASIILNLYLLLR